MKRFAILLLSAALLLALAGCGESQPPVIVELPTQPTATEPGPVVVSNVDELLAAIAPDTQILLEAGTYELSAASDYGKAADSPYYSWTETYDGFELKLLGVENLTLRGSGTVETVLAAQATYANVLTLQNCTGISLENMTLGHSPQSGECAGGVLVLQGCRAVEMQRLGLFGCGVNGLQVNVCSDIRISDSDIYDCSSSGVIAEETDGLTVENCRVYDLGDKQYGGYTVFSLMRTTGVQITGCEIYNNLVQTLITGYPGESMEFSGNTLTGNRIRDVVFDMYGSGIVVLDGNTFENNNIRLWYPIGTEPGMDAQGNVVTEQMLKDAEIREEVSFDPAERTEIHVSTVDEFLAAIGPDTQIILDEELYDFSTATGYGVETGEYYYWEDIFDGPGLVITGVENFGISSDDGKVKNHTLAAIPRYANVLTFSQCQGITLSGFTAGHTQEPGSCAGGVLMFRDCETVQVENCGLYGCGILGVQAEYGKDISVTKCNIYECSQGGIRMYGVDGVTISDCTFRKLGGERILLQSCSNMTINKKTIEGTHYEEQ